MINHGGEVDDEDGDCLRLAASSAHNAPELVHLLAGLAGSSREGLEEDALLGRQLLAHHGDQKHAPTGPAIALDQLANPTGGLEYFAKNTGIGEGLPHGYIAFQCRY